jgi:hypothetical protein
MGQETRPKEGPFSTAPHVSDKPCRSLDNRGGGLFQDGLAPVTAVTAPVSPP